MGMQPDFYLHITGGLAGDAATLMARIALNLNHDSHAYPLDLSELLNVSSLGCHPAAAGLNQLLVNEFVRSALARDVKPWRDDQLRMLQALAGRARASPLRLVSLSSRAEREKP